MPVPSLVFRLTKGIPLTAAEGDENLRRLRNHSNALEKLIGTVLNPDGTLKNNSVSTASIIDRAVTQAKLDWNANFYGVATGTDAYTLTIDPTAGFDLGDGVTESFFCLVKFTNANTGPATIDVNGSGAKDIKKAGSSALESGDIKAGSICALVYDGTQFQILFTFIDVDASGATPPVMVTASAAASGIVVGGVAGLINAVDVVLTKPAGATWLWFELSSMIGLVENAGGAATYAFDWTYETTPEAGNLPGDGMSGIHFVAGSSGGPNPYPLPVNVAQFGAVAATLITNTSITFRLTGRVIADAGGVTATSDSRIYARGVYAP